MHLSPFLSLLAALPAAPAWAEVVVEDASGRTVTLPGPATRVVCASERCVHGLAQLGLRPVGVWPSYFGAVMADPALFGPEAASIPVLPGSEGVDMEALLALDPDLVVAWQGSEAFLDHAALDGVAPVLEVGDSVGVPDVDALGLDLRRIAAATGREAEAEAALDALKRRQGAYLRRLGDTPRREVLVARLGPPDAGTIDAMPCGPLMEAVAACAAPSDSWSNPMTPESVLLLDPEVIVVEDWGTDAGASGPEAWAEAGVPLWAEVPAVSEGRVHSVSALAAVPYSPLSWGLALDALMPLLYPDLFAAPLTDAEVAAALAE